MYRDKKNNLGHALIVANSLQAQSIIATEFILSTGKNGYFDGENHDAYRT